MALEPSFTVVYRDINDSRILTDVYIPPNVADENGGKEPTEVPVIYIVHGLMAVLSFIRSLFALICS